jgi:hypothetical protein
MTRKGETIPGAQMALAAIQLGLALFAAAVDILHSCGACSQSGGLHLGVALLGAMGYGALLASALLGKRLLFYRGVFAAAGIHAALGIVLLLEKRLCVPCFLSLGAAIALAILAAWSPNVGSRYLLSVAAPIAAVTVALFLPNLLWSARGPEAFLGSSRTAGESRPPSTGATSLDVYEESHCGYCQSFRSDYLPLLEAGYPGRLAVRFHDASSAAWVQRTPTFVLGGKLLFEGLPYRYQDLADAVDSELAVQHP